MNLCAWNLLYLLTFKKKVCFVWLIKKTFYCNRWFDKSFTLIVTKDGKAAINFEHSWGDGVAILRFFNEIYSDSTKNHFVDSKTVPANVDPSQRVHRLGQLLFIIIIITEAVRNPYFFTNLYFRCLYVFLNLVYFVFIAVN